MKESKITFYYPFQYFRFVLGNEGVNWMRQHLPVASREEALAIGGELMDHGFITGDGPFTDTQLRFYFLVRIGSFFLISPSHYLLI